MALVVDELEKKIVDEVKKIQPIVEERLVQAVDGRTFSCWGWSVRISRTPKLPTPPKSEETPKSDDTQESHSAPASV